MGASIKFKILATKWVLEFDKSLNDNHASWGQTHLNSKKIIIQEPVEGVRFPLSQVTTTILHEMLHAVLDELSYADLSKDEDFIVRVSAGLSQALQSGKLFNKKKLKSVLGSK
jgi:hypothetical protein